MVPVRADDVEVRRAHLRGAQEEVVDHHTVAGALEIRYVGLGSYWQAESVGDQRLQLPECGGSAVGDGRGTEAPRRTLGRRLPGRATAARASRGRSRPIRDVTASPTASTATIPTAAPMRVLLMRGASMAGQRIFPHR